MMIEQKEFMQLFGSWGYTASQLEALMAVSIVRAHERGDGVGRLVYDCVQSMCVYANTNDAIMAVTHSMPRKDDISHVPVDKIDRNVLESLLENTGGWLDGDTVEIPLLAYCEGVLRVLYERLSKYNNLEDAVMNLRQYTMDSLGMIAIAKVINVASEVADSVFTMMITVALADFEKKSGLPIEFYISNQHRKAFSKVTKVITSRKDRILGIPNEIDGEFSTLTQLIVTLLYDDMPKDFKNISVDAMNCIHMMPHEIFEYTKSYSNIMTAFLVGMELGVFSYDDYDEITAVRVLPDGILKEKDVETIERMRSN